MDVFKKIKKKNSIFIHSKPSKQSKVWTVDVCKMESHMQIELSDFATKMFAKWKIMVMRAPPLPPAQGALLLAGPAKGPRPPSSQTFH